MIERGVLGRWSWRVKITEVNYPAVMAVNALCIVNISLCLDLVKM